MKIGIISGSMRINGESGRIANWFAAEVKSRYDADSYVLDLGKNPLPLWDEGMWGAEAPEGYTYTDWSKVWAPVSVELASCDAFVILAPEYNGTAPAALKNFFHFTSGKEMGHKPGLIVGVSASRNGVYPIAELHSFAGKNNKLNIIPEHLVVRDAGKMFQVEVPAEVADDDTYIRERAQWTLDILVEYAKALAQVRASGKAETKQYAFGM